MARNCSRVRVILITVIMLIMVSHAAIEADELLS